MNVSLRDIVSVTDEFETVHEFIKPTADIRGQKHVCFTVYTVSSWPGLSWGSVVRKIWLFALNLNATLSLVLLCLLDCSLKTKTYHYPLLPGWVIHLSLLSCLLNKKARSAWPTSHSSSTTGCLTKLMVTPRPVSPLQSAAFVHTLLQPHPCCPAPYYKCQRILIWLRVTRSSPETAPLYYKPRPSYTRHLGIINISSQTVNSKLNFCLCCR